ncbi:MAG: adenosylcobinamide-GDP ribazoletransferase [Saccharofermentanales bacterium]|jgi:adenosylcobinamide-GDP ribazoletransferase
MTTPERPKGSAFFLACSTFTILPVPQHPYDPRHMASVLAYFPWMGLAGIALAIAIIVLTELMAAATLLRAVLVVGVLIAMTGAIHLDGFADTVDALMSHRDRDEQLRIMRDPHIGTFAVVALIFWALIATAAWSSLLARSHWPTLGAALVTEIFGRSLSGLYSATLPSAHRDGMQHTQTSRQAPVVRPALTVAYLLSSAAMIAFGHYAGIIAVVLATVTALIFRRFSKRAFHGATGDLAGFLFTVIQAMTWLILALAGGLPKWF